MSQMTCLIRGAHKWIVMSVLHTREGSTVKRQILQRCECGRMRHIDSAWTT